MEPINYNDDNGIGKIICQFCKKQYSNTSTFNRHLNGWLSMLRGGGPDPEDDISALIDTETKDGNDDEVGVQRDRHKQNASKLTKRRTKNKLSTKHNLVHDNNAEECASYLGAYSESHGSGCSGGCDRGRRVVLVARTSKRQTGPIGAWRPKLS